MKNKFTAKVVGKVVEFLTGTSASDVEDIMVGDPQELRVKARKLLGLEVRDLAMIYAIKRITPMQWSLEYLGIPRKVYDEYKAQVKRGAADLKDEYPRIRLQAEVNELEEKLPKLDGFIAFQNSLTKLCRPLFEHTKKWRYVAPIIHLQLAKEVLDSILERNTMTILDVFRINIYLYYATYNAIVGIKLDKKETLAVAA